MSNSMDTIRNRLEGLLVTWDNLLGISLSFILKVNLS